MAEDDGALEAGRLSGPRPERLRVANERAAQKLRNWTVMKSVIGHNEMKCAHEWRKAGAA